MLELFYTIGNAIVDRYRAIKIDNSGITSDNHQVTPYGFDSVPIKGLLAVRSNTESKSVVLGYIQKAIDGLNKGDSVLFSKDGKGKVVASIILRNDGKIEVECDGDINIVSSGTVDINNGNLTIEP